MNKKFLSAILFGALMVTSTGTFVSCKDYDDDIDRIDTELSGIKSQIAALQTAVDNGKWITNVATTSDGIAITMNDGTTYNVTNGKDGAPGAAGAAGEDGKDGAPGDKVEINDEGLFVINGEATEWKALAKDAETGETIKIKTPTVSEDGCWVFYDEKGEAHATTIKVAPVTAVQNSDKTWTLTVFDANGGSQTIDIPTAAALLTDLIVLDPDNANLEYWAYEFKYGFNINAPKRNEWKGPRTIPAKDGMLVAGTTTIPVQINPTTIDATEIDFSLVDSKNNYPYAITLFASEDQGLQTTTSRAAYGNGMYRMVMEDIYFDNTGYYNYFVGQFKSNGASKLYAVTAGGDVRSAYTVVVKGANAGLKLTNVQIKLGSSSVYSTPSLGAEYGEKDDPAYTGINMGQWYSVAGSAAAALYDMYLSVDNDYTTLYGIELKNEEGNWQFRITRTPDNITRATFPLVVETVDKEGAYKKTTIWVKQSDILSTGYTYDAISYELKDVTANKNRFSIALSELKDYLGADNLALWNTKVDLTKTSVVIKDPIYNSTVASGTMGTELYKGTTNTGITPIIVEKNIDGQSNVTDKSKTNYVQFQIENKAAAAATYDLNYQYVAEITFKTTDGSVLTTTKVPFTLTIPAITTVFQLDNNFIVNGDAVCYMYAEDITGSAAGKSTFKLNRVFSKFSTKSYTVELDNTTKVGETDKTSAQLATVGVKAPVATDPAISTATADATYITLRDKDLTDVNTGLQAGYGESLKLSISGYFAGAWSYGDETFDFTVKILSPIYEGGVKPKTGNAVVIPATELDGYKFGNNDIIGNTYNTAVTYNVLPDQVSTTAPWSRKEIKAVVAQSSNVNVFTLSGTSANGWYSPYAATYGVKEDGTTDPNVVIGGYFALNAQNVPATTTTNAITVKVTDIWGYVKPSTVNVTITVE